MTRSHTRPRWLHSRRRPLDLGRQPLLSIAAAAAAGILIDRVLPLPPALWIVTGIAAAVLLVRTGGLVRWCLLLLLVVAAFAVRSGWEQQRYDSAPLLVAGEQPQPAVVEGTVVGVVQRIPMPRYRGRGDDSPWRTRFDLEIDAVRDAEEFVPWWGRAAVTVDDDAPEIRSGDRLRVAGKLSGFSPPTNPGETDFRSTARNRRQHARLSVDSVGQVERLGRSGFGLFGAADDISRQGEQTLRDSLGDKTGSIAAALVVGRRGGIEPELHDRLLETGTIHLLSVSGLHMGIVAAALTGLSILLGMRTLAQIVFVGGFCLVFVAVTGARPPVVRAATLVGVVLAARAAGRIDSPLNSLALAAVALMWWNPTNLFQPGVHLSFISVATLLCCGFRYDPMNEQLHAEAQLEQLIDARKSRWRRYVRKLGIHTTNALWFSLCVTAATAPLVWMNFHLLTPVAVPTNVLLAFPMAAALIGGLVAVTLGLVSQWLAMPAAWVCYAALWIMEAIIRAAAEVPGGHFWLPSPPTWWVAAFYLALVGGFAATTDPRWNRIVAGRLKRVVPVPRSLRPLSRLGGWVATRPRMFVSGSLLWCLIAWFLATLPARRPPGGLEATFVDVGHGTSVLVRQPSGRNLLYDCGWLGNYNHTSRSIEDVLWASGLTRLDAIAISHADADHFNALPGLLRRFNVGEIVVPVGMLDVPKPGLRPIREAIVRAGVPVREVSLETGELFPHGDVAILHPPREGVVGNENANSLVLRIDHAGRPLLLPGDLEPPGLEVMLDLPRPPAGGVLMAPHHGSTTVDSRPTLQWSRPREVVVSGGTRAMRPEVEQMLAEYGSGVHITARDGAIRVIITGSQIDVRGWRNAPW